MSDNYRENGLRPELHRIKPTVSATSSSKKEIKSLLVDYQTIKLLIIPYGKSLSDYTLCKMLQSGIYLAAGLDIAENINMFFCKVFPNK